MFSKATPQITPGYVAKQKEAWQGLSPSDCKLKLLSSSLFPLLLFCQAKKTAVLLDDASSIFLWGVTSASSSLISDIIDTVTVHCCFAHWGLVRCWDRNHYFKKTWQKGLKKTLPNLLLEKCIEVFLCTNCYWNSLMFTWQVCYQHWIANKCKVQDEDL